MIESIRLEEYYEYHARIHELISSFITRVIKANMPQMNFSREGIKILVTLLKNFHMVIYLSSFIGCILRPYSYPFLLPTYINNYSTYFVTKVELLTNHCQQLMRNQRNHPVMQI